MNPDQSPVPPTPPRPPVSMGYGEQSYQPLQQQPVEQPLKDPAKKNKAKKLFFISLAFWIIPLPLVVIAQIIVSILLTQSMSATDSVQIIRTVVNIFSIIAGIYTVAFGWIPTLITGLMWYNAK